MIGVGDAVLTFNYPAVAGMSKIKTALKIPIITDVERSVNVNLTELPTIIYGCRNNFCMDLGATEKVTFKCERINPMPYNDLSSSPEDWSNGKWYRHLEELFDRWQNFGMDGSDVRTGGCQLRFTPADTELMAPIRANVFLVGSLNLNYSIQKMTFSLPLQLATMRATGGGVETVRLTLRTELDNGSTDTEYVEVLKGYAETVNLPSKWVNIREGKVFQGWRIAGTTATIDAGQSYTFGKDETLDAIWVGAEYAKWIPSDITFTIRDIIAEAGLAQGITRVRFYAIGGGGGGGGSGFRFQGSIPQMGGAGGAGETIDRVVSVSSDTTVTVKIGSGGSGGTNRAVANPSHAQPTAGGNGGATEVSIGGSTYRALGGSGGAAATLSNLSGTDGAGGQQYVAGGSRGADGHFLAPNIAKNAGKGGSEGDHRGGGGGGGAGAFRYRVDTEHNQVPSSDKTEFLESIGGDGGDGSTGADAQDGQLGGGGGSGWKDNSLRSGVGGAGGVLMIFFR